MKRLDDAAPGTNETVAKWVHQTAATVNAIIDPFDPWHEVGGTDEPTFENNWDNVGGTYDTLAFRLDAQGRVQFKGQIDTGLRDTACFTLPLKYRPVKDKRIIVAAAVATYIEVTTAGLVKVMDMAGW